MPIRVEALVHKMSNRGPISLGDILPGGIGSFTDHNSADSHIIVVGCNPADNGGFVERYELENTEVLADNSRAILDSDAGNLLAIFGSEERFFARFTTSQGLGTLMLTHYKG